MGSLLLLPSRISKLIFTPLIYTYFSNKFFYAFYIKVYKYPVSVNTTTNLNITQSLLRFHHTPLQPLPPNDLYFLSLPYKFLSLPKWSVSQPSLLSWRPPAPYRPPCGASASSLMHLIAALPA
jgi:hypothetical protein